MRVLYIKDKYHNEAVRVAKALKWKIAKTIKPDDDVLFNMIYLTVKAVVTSQELSTEEFIHIARQLPCKLIMIRKNTLYDSELLGIKPDTNFLILYLRDTLDLTFSNIARFLNSYKIYTKFDNNFTPHSVFIQYNNLIKKGGYNIDNKSRK